MKKETKCLLVLISVLSLIGLLMIYSASSIWSLYKYNDSFHFLKLQLIYLIISYLAMFIITKVDYHFFKHKCNLILIICLILLIVVLIPGIGILKNGSRSWLSLGLFSMQPSEFTKIGLIIYLAKYLSNNQKDINKSVKNILPLLLLICFYLSFIMLEPDFGSAFVIALTLIIIIFASGLKLSFFTFGGILGIIGIIGLIIIAPYRLKRIVAFLNPWSDPLGSGYQIIQSLYAIGSAGIFGLGYGNSIQKQFYLPEPQNDFIFAIIAEEFGIIGVMVIVWLFIAICIIIFKISIRQNDLFAKYLSLGLGLQIILQAILNMCVVVGLIPVTG